MFKLRDLIAAIWRDLFGQARQLRAQLELAREQRDAARLERDEACAQRDRYLVRVVELGLRNDALVDEVAMLRRCDAVREKEIPSVPN